MSKRDPVATGVLIALAVIGIIGVLWFLWRISTIVIVILIAAVVATGIAPSVKRMTSWRLPPRGWRLPKGIAILLVYAGLVIVLGGLLLIVGTVVVREAIQLAQNSPAYYDQAVGALTDLHARYPSLPDLPAIADRFRNQIGAISSYIYGAATRLVGFLGNLLVLAVIFVIAYYMLTGEHELKEGFLRLVPPPHRRRYSETFSEMGDKMGSWLRAQLLLAGIIGAVVSIGMYIIGIPYALIIGITGAIAELLPLVGPSVAAIPAVLLALFMPKWQLIAVIIFFVVLSQLEGNYLVPKIMRRQVGLNPILTIVALLAGASVAGFVGALLAIPLAAAFQIFFGRIVLPAIESAEDGK